MTTNKNLAKAILEPCLNVSDFPDYQLVHPVRQSAPQLPDAPYYIEHDIRVKNPNRAVAREISRIDDNVLLSDPIDRITSADPAGFEKVTLLFEGSKGDFVTWLTNQRSS